LDYERLYEYRFRDVNQDTRAAVWKEIAQFIYGALGSPRRVLDPAAGRCEFLNAIPSEERWGVDTGAYAPKHAAPGVKTLVSDIFKAELPPNYFDAVFVSNFLEHLNSREEVAAFLEKMHGVLKPGGQIAVVGPNFKHCQEEYFDCGDHNLALTEVSTAELLYAAGFQVERVHGRFIPYSFRSRLPVRPFLVRLYLKMSPAWRVLGKQFMILARK